MRVIGTFLIIGVFCITSFGQQGNGGQRPARLRPGFRPYFGAPAAPTRRADRQPDPYTGRRGVESDVQLIEKLEGFRRSTLGLLNEHFRAHPDCQWRPLVPAIRGATITVGEHPTASAWARAESFSIGFSRSWQWDQREATLAWLHEATHLAGLCGPDARRQRTPICYVQGRPVYWSGDIDPAIEAHLNAYRR